MLEAIRTSQECTEDEVSGNIIADLRKRGLFGGFGEERMQLVLEGMRNKVEYALKDSRKMAGQVEECSDSKGLKSVLNGRSFKYHFGGGRFYMLPQYYEISHGLYLKNFLQFLLIDNQRYQVTPFRYINWEDEVSRLVRGRKVLGGMNYLMRSVKKK